MSGDGRAAELVARLGPGEVQALAVAAMAVLLAQEESLADITHREHVQGIIQGSAPTFHAALSGLLRRARSYRVR